MPRKEVATHPIQPLVLAEDGLDRFKANKIVRFLLDTYKPGMNELACMGFPAEDWEQFAQLIGYSLRGFGELSYVSDRVYNTAARRKVWPA